MSLMDPILDRVADLRASISGQVVLRWGTVTELDPFRVQLDADTDPLPFKPNRTVAGLEVGDRVLAAVQNRRVTVIGRAGGQPIPVPGQGEIPTTITTTGAGSSASIAPDGTITATNCATLNIDGIFNGGDAAVYELHAKFSMTAVGTLGTRLRNSGVTYAATTHNYVAHYTRNSSGPSRYSTFGNSIFGYWWPGPVSNVASEITGTLWIYQPNRNATTTIRLESNVATGDRFLISEYGDTGGGSAQPFDGFTILATAGSFSGTIKTVRVA